MYNFSILLDKIDDEAYGINNIELRDGAFQKPLAEMDGAEVEVVRDKLIFLLRKIVLYTIAHPLSDYNYYLKFFRNAHLLNIENVKICLCTLKDGDTGLAEVLELARSFDIPVLFEMRHKYDFFSESSYRKIKTPHTGLIVNLAEGLLAGVEPFFKMLYYSHEKNDVKFLRVVDGIINTATPTPLECGNAEIKEAVSLLLSRSFKGYFSFTDYRGGHIRETINEFCEMLTRM